MSEVGQGDAVTGNGEAPVKTAKQLEKEAKKAEKLAKLQEKQKKLAEKKATEPTEKEVSSFIDLSVCVDLFTMSNLIYCSRFDLLHLFGDFRIE